MFLRALAGIRCNGLEVPRICVSRAFSAWCPSNKPARRTVALISALVPTATIVMDKARLIPDGATRGPSNTGNRYLAGEPVFHWLTAC